MTISLKVKFSYLLDGFEAFNFTEEQLQLVMSSLENARLDMEFCTTCDGNICRTMINRRARVHPKTLEFEGWDFRKQVGKMFYALSPEGCATYKRPVFSLFRCPGVVQRKEQLISIFRRVKSKEKKREAAGVYK